MLGLGGNRRQRVLNAPTKVSTNTDINMATCDFFNK